jgi:hypothetical protein
MLNGRGIFSSCAPIAICLALTLFEPMGSRAQPATATGQVPPAPVFDVKIQPGYRDWKLISVAHEAGKLNDIRAILGNDIAVEAYRKGTVPFPDGAAIARVAWSYTPSEENNKVFGQPQSFVAGAPVPAYLQFMVKDAKKYAATGGWGFAQFDKDGHPAPATSLTPCFPCHKPVAERDFLFTHYAP